jgi:aromatic-amino-acid transaminase
VLEHLLPARRHFTGEDSIFQANAEASARRAAGEDILNATLGALVDDSGHLVILETTQALWQDLTPLEWAPYAPITGDPAFLTALVQRHWPLLTSHGVGCATPGGCGALMLSVRNFLEPGMAVLAATPFWGPYSTLTQENGASLVTAPFPEPGQALDGEAWERAGRDLLARQGRLLVWLNDPCHNPTGHSLSPEDRATLREVLRRLATRGPVTLLLDCAYLDYTADPGHVRQALDDYAVLGAEGSVLVGASLSLSKSLTLYGGRCGALVFPWCESGALQAALAVSCRGIYANCARAPQSLLVRLARDGKAQERLHAEHRHWSDVLVTRALALDRALTAEGFPGVSWKGGFFVTLRLADSQATYRRMKTDGVYGVPLPEGLRVGLCGLRAQDAPRLAAALRRAVPV